MLTPQEVSARSFTKAVMGGYNMTMVDEFLDELTDDYTSLYKENASLKAKLKVLVEKVEEYRATEDSMRVTLLAAQRMAESIVQEAQEKAEEIRKQADRSAKDQIEEAQRELARTEQKLAEGKQALQRFINDGKRVCGQALDFLDRLPEYAPETTPLEQIEKNVMDAAASEQPAPAPAEAAAPVTPAVAEKPAVSAKAAAPVKAAAPMATPEPKPPVSSPTTKISVPVTAAATEAAPVSKPAAVPEPSSVEPQPDLDATRRVNLDELKFGPRYRGETR